MLTGKVLKHGGLTLVVDPVGPECPGGTVSLVVDGVGLMVQDSVETDDDVVAFAKWWVPRLRAWAAQKSAGV